MWTSDDQGASWTLDLELTWIPELAVDRGSGWQFAAADEDGLYAKSAATEWVQITRPTGQDVNAATVAGSTSPTLLASSSAGVFRMPIPPQDGWTLSSAGLADHDPRAIEVVPDGPQLVLVEDGSALLLSEDGGDHWRNLNDGPRRFRSAGATLLQGGGILTVDQDRGIGRSYDLGRSWQWEHPDWYDPGLDTEYPLKIWTSRASPSSPLVLITINGGDFGVISLCEGKASAPGEWRLMDWDTASSCQSGGTVYVELLSATSSWEGATSLRAFGNVGAYCHGGGGAYYWFQSSLGDGPEIPATPDRALLIDTPADAPDQWYTLCQDEAQSEKILYRWRSGRWRELGRGGLINGFSFICPLLDSESEAWLAAGNDGS